MRVLSRVAIPEELHADCVDKSGIGVLDVAKKLIIFLVGHPAEELGVASRRDGKDLADNTRNVFIAGLDRKCSCLVGGSWVSTLFKRLTTLDRIWNRRGKAGNKSVRKGELGIVIEEPTRFAPALLPATMIFSVLIPR